MFIILITLLLSFRAAAATQLKLQLTLELQCFSYLLGRAVLSREGGRGGGRSLGMRIGTFLYVAFKGPLAARRRVEVKTDLHD